ncbi:hypothetical protein KKH27_14645 [bacterium]|nr:hypothetical protein [bacterium]MBU1983767.1 hypothetical protein [bacterium]
MKWHKLVWQSALAALICLALLSCANEDNPPPDGNGNDEEVPAGMARISGTIRDAAGDPISNVYLHVIYEFPQTANETAADPLIPSVTAFYNIDQPLHTSCDGTEPLPDGVMLKIFWDRDSDGPDDEDPQPPLCDDPPMCLNGPSRTVNYIEFPINGQALEIGAGLFYAETYLVTTGDMLIPNRFYVRIYCSNGRVLYTSQVVDVPGGPSEQELNFTCDSCEGIPELPTWRLDQSYPNPAEDSVTISFGLAEAARTQITLRWPDQRHVETLLDSMYSTGGHRWNLLLDDRPNGLYTVRTVAGTFQSEHTVLKNVSNYDRLRSTDERVLTNEQGGFTFDAAAGAIIAQRDGEGGNLGEAQLSRLKVVAIKVGYQIADTTFDVASSGSYPINLTLRTP